MGSLQGAFEPGPAFWGLTPGDAAEDDVTSTDRAGGPKGPSAAASDPAETGAADVEPLKTDYLAALALRLADAARAETMAHFRMDGLEAADKRSRGVYDPVTEGDRAAERAIRALLAETRPEDGILGEEEAAVASRSGATWVIDPIDGTRAFITGLPTWGTLIALDDGSRGILGLVDHPATDERYLGRAGHGAWLIRSGGQQRVRCRTGLSLAEATLITTAPELFTAEERPAFEAVRATARLTRYGTDCYGYSMVALGQADLVIEAGLEAYDIAAPKALVEAAGGVVTDWEGGDCRWGGRVVAAASPALHTETLAHLAAAQR